MTCLSLSLAADRIAKRDRVENRYSNKAALDAELLRPDTHGSRQRESLRVFGWDLTFHGLAMDLESTYTRTQIKRDGIPPTSYESKVAPASSSCSLRVLTRTYIAFLHTHPHPPTPSRRAR